MKELLSLDHLSAAIFEQIQGALNPYSEGAQESLLLPFWLTCVMTLSQAHLLLTARGTHRLHKEILNEPHHSWCWRNLLLLAFLSTV